MSFHSVFGQDLALKIIQRALASNSLAQAYLFYGPDSIGKKLTAMNLAKALNCLAPGPAGSCDVCSPCKRIEQNNHPDVHCLKPERLGTAREAYIRIENIRELQRKLGYLAYEGRHKVAIVDGVEQMNVQASNAFLKTLEEPPPSTVLILIAANPFLLLPTLRSRCQGVRFQPLPAEAVRRILATIEDLEPEELEFRAAHCLGQVRQAFDPQAVELHGKRPELIDLVEKVSFQRMDLVFSWARSWAKKAEMAQPLLELLLKLIRDMACLKAGNGGARIDNRDLATALKQAAESKTLSALLAMFDAVQQTKHLLAGNANLQLALENMLLRFCDAHREVAP